MLSTKETAELLGISPQRVRAMISSGVLPAAKVGKSWMIRKEDAMARKEQGRAACRTFVAESGGFGLSQQTHELYEAGRQLSKEPLHMLISQAASKDEAAFAVAVREFFLQRAQRDLVERGCF